MPTISRFYGISIRMFFNEKHAPHFHAVHGEHKALIEVATGAVSAGRLPERELRFVRKWAKLHQRELLLNWERARRTESLLKIDPLK
ncbi:MAG: DUF4160 domain-containing protein [Chloroflexota bacterium]|nr:MAG: DUF4160 domain-containing protein [Chloroflexota bacterium]